MRWFRRSIRAARSATAGPPAPGFVAPGFVADRHPTPDRERVVELAWLPLWQAQLVLHHLWEADVPTTLSETAPVPWRIGMHEPMARLYVMERRLAAARAAMAKVLDDG